jgi:hypothetical protein
MTIRTALGFVVLSLIVCAAAAAAPQPTATKTLPAATIQPAAAPAPPAAGCGQTPGLFPALAPADHATRPGQLSGPACTLDRPSATNGARPFHGFCRCSCTFTPDCNTSADCGGSPCLAGVTCC